MAASQSITRRRSKAAQLARIAAFGLPAAALLATEERIARWWPLRFPRSLTEFDRDPQRLHDLLTMPSRGLLAPIVDRAHARLITQTRSGTLGNEPDKNLLTAFFDLSIEEGDRRRTVRDVTKFQSGRGMPLYMQAIRAVAEDFAREIEFYRRLAALVPVEVPRPIFADAVTPLNRICLVMERADGETVADWRGCSLPAIQVLLASVARLNAAFLGRIDTPATNWIPARAGLEFADYVSSFISKQPPWYRGIWIALQAFFDSAPVTLVHGDCRPGNMVFRGVNPVIGDRSEDAASAWADAPPTGLASVVMCDWQAINVAPLLWDFTYCTVVGLRVADRREWQPRLLHGFLEALSDAGVDRRQLEPQRAALEIQLLSVVLAFISLVVVDNKLWSGQGNTREDIAAWSRRVLEAGAALEVEAISAALNVPCDDIRRLQAYFLARAR